jgi:predicted fused transcriptional regulator/phosphomethylpyrimidine kinase
MSQNTQHDEILGNLTAAVNMLESCQAFAALVPEVRVNLAYALRDAKANEEVAAIDGRITVVRGFPLACGRPTWGASDHLSRRIIEIRKYASDFNAVINFKYDQQILATARHYAQKKGILFGSVEREEEPDEYSTRDGKSMPWKVRRLQEKYGKIPQLFYEDAGWGKEPLFLALGKNAVEVASIACDIAELYKQQSACQTIIKQS